MFSTAMSALAAACKDEKDSVPEPDILKKNLDAFVADARFTQAVTYETATGSKTQPLFSARTIKAHRDALIHVTKACISDPPGLEMVYTDAEGKLRTKRGSSQVEAIHRLIHAAFASPHTGPQLAHAIFSHLVHNYNVA